METTMFEVTVHEETAIVEYDGFEWEVAYEYNPEEHCNTERGTQTIPESYTVYKIGNIFGCNITEQYIAEKPDILDILSEILTEQMKN